MIIELNAKTAVDARREAAQRFPQGGHLTGYIGEECVYITVVRERGNKAHVATATKGRPAKRFVFEPTEELHEKKA